MEIPAAVEVADVMKHRGAQFNRETCGSWEPTHSRSSGLSSRKTSCRDAKRQVARNRSQIRHFVIPVSPECREIFHP